MSASSLAAALAEGYSECTAYVASALSWVPGNWGNASQWLTDALNSGFSTTNQLSQVQPGDIAVIAAGAQTNQGQASSAGHVAVVESVNPSAGTVVLQGANWPYGVSDTAPNDLTFDAADIAGFIEAPTGSGALPGTTTPATLTSAKVTEPSTPSPGILYTLQSLMDPNLVMTGPSTSSNPIISTVANFFGGITDVGDVIQDAGPFLVMIMVRGLVFGMSIVLLVFGLKMAFGPDGPAQTIINVAEAPIKMAKTAAVAAAM
jgi:surface antigen